MEKIQNSLARIIKDEPGKKFKVLIGYEPGMDPNQLKLKNYKEVMEGILSATITGKEIAELSIQEGINYIETDEEMSTF